jgi:hypothetical protein
LEIKKQEDGKTGRISGIRVQRPNTLVPVLEQKIFPSSRLPVFYLSLSIDAGWRDVAAVALAFAKQHAT